jgi:hypothetical protein
MRREDTWVEGQCVHLGRDDLKRGICAGVMRHGENIMLGRPNYHNLNHTAKDWQYHIEGALAELAVATLLGIEWAGKGQFRGRDVGPFDVRSSAYYNADLRIHDSDTADVPYILVIGSNGDYEVVGWEYARAAQDPAYEREPVKGRPCYLYPRHALRPISDLPGVTVVSDPRRSGGHGSLVTHAARHGSGPA